MKHKVLAYLKLIRKLAEHEEAGWDQSDPSRLSPDDAR
jgi:hypothetical protein